MLQELEQVFLILEKQIQSLVGSLKKGEKTETEKRFERLATTETDLIRRLRKQLEILEDLDKRIEALEKRQ